MAQAFVSYSRRDLPFVEKLVSDLKKAGVEVWYDLSGLEGGARWRAEIQNAIKNSQNVIVVLSPDSVESEWVEREFLFASNLKRKVIPLLYRSCDIPLNYLDLNYIDVQGENYQQNFNRLLRVLNLDEPAFISSAGIPSKGLQSERIKPPKTGRKIALALGSGVMAVAIIICVTTLMAGLWPQQFKFPMALAPITQTPTLTLTPTTETLTPTLTLTPTETLIPALLYNNTEILDPFGVPIRRVPAGEFMMGVDADVALLECQKTYPECVPAWPHVKDGAPPHLVYLDAFYIDQFEVTNGLYKECVNAGVCNPPKQSDSKTRSSYYGNSEFDNYPVIYVDWNMAETYCEWRGAYLPTEAQWEKAARGMDGRIYSWGNTINCSYANYWDKDHACIGNTSPVGSYETGKSPYGVYDLAGNVWEWVADWYSDSYYQNSPSSNPLGPDLGMERVFRGGSWDATDYLVRTVLRNKVRPTDYYYSVGFRCARDTNP